MGNSNLGLINFHASIYKVSLFSHKDEHYKLTELKGQENKTQKHRNDGNS